VEQRLGLRRIEGEAPEFDQIAAAQLVGDERRAVGGDAERWAAGVARDIGEIVRQAAAHVVELVAEVGLPLEDGTGEQRVDPPLHARAPVLLPQIGGGHAEAVPQDLGQMRAHGFMARPTRERSSQFREGVGAPGRGHGD